MDAKGLILLLMIGGIIAVVVKLRRGRRPSGPGPIALARPIMQAFFERTGYAFPDLRQAPVPAQVDRWEQIERAQFTSLQHELQIVRSYQGLEIHFRHAQSTTTEGRQRTRSYSQTWSTPPLQISAPFHVVHRGLLAPGALGRATNWQPAFPHAVPTGDPEIDQRYVFFTPMPQDRLRHIALNPRFRAALLSLPYVDLRVLPDCAVFSDPVQLNLVTAMGGPGASATLMSKPGKAFEIGLPVHERIADLLLGASSLAR